MSAIIIALISPPRPAERWLNFPLAPRGRFANPKPHPARGCLAMI